MKKIFIVGAAVLTASIALAPPLAPSLGDQCMNWHATATGPNGQMMTCTHLPDSGHLMYWEYGGPRDSG